MKTSYRGAAITTIKNKDGTWSINILDGERIKLNGTKRQFIAEQDAIEFAIHWIDGEHLNFEKNVDETLVDLKEGIMSYAAEKNVWIAREYIWGNKFYEGVLTRLMLDFFRKKD